MYLFFFTRHFCTANIEFDFNVNQYKQTNFSFLADVTNQLFFRECYFHMGPLILWVVNQSLKYTVLVTKQLRARPQRLCPQQNQEWQENKIEPTETQQKPGWNTLPDKDKSDLTHPVQQEPPKIRQDNTKLLQDISTAKKKNKKKHR